MPYVSCFFYFYLPHRQLSCEESPEEFQMLVFLRELQERDMIHLHNGLLCPAIHVI